MDKRQALAIGLLTIKDCIRRYSRRYTSDDLIEAGAVIRGMLDVERGWIPPAEPKPRGPAIRVHEVLVGERHCRAFELLDCITAVGGIPPTGRELQEAVGYRSNSTLHTWLCRWRRAGLVTWRDGRNRTLRTV